MRAHGYRAKSDQPGAPYAEEALQGSADPEALANFDRIRRGRNRTQYGAAVVGRAQLQTDLEHARAIVRSVAARFDDT
jgi:hypothetical protein